MQTGFARLAPFSGYKGIFLLSILILLLIAVLTAVDQFIKMTVITNLKPIGSVTCIPGLLEFRYLENNGAAFGFFAGLSWLLIILTIGLMAALLVFLFRYKHHTWMSRTSCVLIIAGGIGNLLTVLFSAMWSITSMCCFFRMCSTLQTAAWWSVRFCLPCGTYSLKTKKKRQIKK